jgi:hypothetical protein
MFEISTNNHSIRKQINSEYFKNSKNWENQIKSNQIKSNEYHSRFDSSFMYWKKECVFLELERYLDAYIQSTIRGIPTIYLLPASEHFNYVKILHFVRSLGDISQVYELSHLYVECKVSNNESNTALTQRPQLTLKTTVFTTQKITIVMKILTNDFI